jgi:2-polyprenyl-3-methyl-5-hydroxy-6-metoxy-1,4-benzoquinol methylase
MNTGDFIMATTKKTVKKTAVKKAKVPTTSQVTKPKATAAKKTAVAKAPATKVAKKVVRVISNEERYKMIEQAAYYIAERSGFKADPKESWIVAEKEVDARLASGK